jgi:hypothetical protein
MATNFFEDLKYFVEDKNADDHEHLANIGLAFKGWQKNEMTEEHRKNLSLSASKRIRTKEHIEKLHNGRRNSTNTPEHTAAILASRIGSIHSNETKVKMSQRKLDNPLTKLNASNAGKKSAMKRPPNYSELQSLRAKAAWKKRKEGIVNGD